VSEVLPCPDPLLHLRGIRVSLGGREILRGLDIDLNRGESLGLVGESGSGKSTLARVVLGLTRPDAGVVRFAGTDLTRAGTADWKRARRQLQVIFQDPGASLNPRMSVEEIIAEPLIVHRAYDEARPGLPRREWLAARVASLLADCGLSPDSATRLPGQFSGGQKQRIAIARALALRPSLIICDEPTSALDVSIQAQIINLLSELRDSHGIAYLFISHDLAVVSHFCSRIAVLREGLIIENGPTEALLDSPKHEYTRELLAAAGHGGGGA